MIFWVQNCTNGPMEKSERNRTNLQNPLLTGFQPHFVTGFAEHPGIRQLEPRFPLPTPTGQWERQAIKSHFIIRGFGSRTWLSTLHQSHFTSPLPRDNCSEKVILNNEGQSMLWTIKVKALFHVEFPAAYSLCCIPPSSRYLWSSRKF